MSKGFGSSEINTPIGQIASEDGSIDAIIYMIPILAGQADALAPVSVQESTVVPAVVHKKDTEEVNFQLQS